MSEGGPAAAAAGLRDAVVAELVERALAEDIGAGDITGEATVGPELAALARIKAKARLMVAT